MSVEVQYLGRLGNHLFQYAFGRIVAQRLGYELRCVVDLDRLVRKTSVFGAQRDCGAIATLPQLTSHFHNAPQLLAGKHVAAPEERYFAGEPGPSGARWDGHHLDLTKLLSNRSERRLIFRGYFQRFEYYRAHQAQLREWFALEPLVDPYGITRRDVVVNIRRGWDYALKGWAISLSSYKQLLRGLPHDRVFVCGTGIDDAVREGLAELSPIYYSATPIDEFRFLMKFDQIVQSNSTFSWWASFLSEASAVYTPRPDRGFLSKEGLGDALETGEQRNRLFPVRVARFIPFQRNPRATLRLVTDAGGLTSLVVESASAGVARLDCAPPLGRFYQWLVERREPFGVEDLVEAGLLTRELVEPVVGPLAEKGAIVLEARFLED
jgi:hypothetical protein